MRGAGTWREDRGQGRDEVQEKRDAEVGGGGSGADGGGGEGAPFTDVGLADGAHPELGEHLLGGGRVRCGGWGQNHWRHLGPGLGSHVRALV